MTTTTVLAYIPSPPQGVWHLGPLPIRAYALLIIVGIIIGCWWGSRRWIARGGQEGEVLDVAVWAVPFGLIGGRIYHVMTDWSTYFGSDAVKEPIDALKIWEGGLGIWGAVAFGALGAWIGCRRHGIKLGPFGDAIAPAILLAQAIGRIGNYFNQELFGGTTTLPWGLEIYDRRNSFGVVGPSVIDGVSTGHVNVGLAPAVHPTFLYELLWNVFVVLVLVTLDRYLRIGHGRLFALYVAGYCMGRFGIELMRTDHATEILGIRINVFTAAIVFACAAAYFVLAPKGRELGLTMYQPWRAAELEDEGVIGYVDPFDDEDDFEDLADDADRDDLASDDSSRVRPGDPVTIRKADAEPDPVAESEADAVAEPEPDAEPAPEPEPDAENEAEAVAEVAAVAVTGAEDTPADAASTPDDGSTDDQEQDRNGDDQSDADQGDDNPDDDERGDAGEVAAPAAAAAVTAAVTPAVVRSAQSAGTQEAAGPREAADAGDSSDHEAAAATDVSDDDDVDRIVSVTRDIAAPASTIFELIADPAQQPRWDGNSNLAQAGAGQRVHKVGDVFTMTITRGQDRRNHIVEFEEGKLIAWLPSEPDGAPPGHLWRWELAVVDDDHTTVTHTYDWTRLADPKRLERARWTTPDKLQASIDRLAELAETQGRPDADEPAAAEPEVEGEAPSSAPAQPTPNVTPNIVKRADAAASNSEAANGDT